MRIQCTSIRFVYSYGDNSHDSSDIVNVGIAVGLDENLEGDLELECDADLATT